MVQVGDRVTIRKGPFLYDRVFLFPGSPGIVRKIAGEGAGAVRYTVEYRDREGFTHLVEGLSEGDIQPA